VYIILRQKIFDRKPNKIVDNDVESATQIKHKVIH